MCVCVRSCFSQRQQGAAISWRRFLFFHTLTHNEQKFSHVMCNGTEPQSWTLNVVNTHDLSLLGFPTFLCHGHALIESDVGMICLRETEHVPSLVQVCWCWIVGCLVWIGGGGCRWGRKRPTRPAAERLNGPLQGDMRWAGTCSELYSRANMHLEWQNAFWRSSDTDVLLLDLATDTSCDIMLQPWREISKEGAAAL